MSATCPLPSPPVARKRDCFRRQTCAWEPQQVLSIEAGEEAARQISARHVVAPSPAMTTPRIRQRVARHQARAKAAQLALSPPTRREMQRDSLLLLETRRAHQEHFDAGARNTRGAYRSTAASPGFRFDGSPRRPRGSPVPAPKNLKRAASARSTKGGERVAQLELETPAWIHQALMSERMHLGTTPMHFAREKRRSEAAARRADAMGEWSDRICKLKGKGLFEKSKGAINSNPSGFINLPMLTARY